MHQKVHWSQRLPSFGSHRFRLDRIRHVPTDEHSAHAERLHLLQGAACRVVLRKVIESDSRAFGRKPQAHRPSNPAGTARYQRAAALVPPVHSLLLPFPRRRC